MVLLDTNFLIYLIKKEDKIIQTFRDFFLHKEEVMISFISKIELLSFPRISEKEHKDINSVLKLITVIYIDDYIINTSINIREKYKIPLPDAIIAATALEQDVAIYTRNIKDFKKISRLNVIKI